MDDQRFTSRICRAVVLLSCVALTSGCASTNLPSVNEDNYLVVVDEERLFNRSREAIASLNRSGMVYQDADLEAYLNEIYQKLLPHDLEDNQLQFRVQVVDQPETNAFALSNGQMYISTAMLTLMDNEDQLASLVGHEMTHIIKRHGLKTKRSTANKAAFFQSVSIIGPLAAFGAVSSISGYSRELEREADQGGFEAMHQHGYNLSQAAVLYENLIQFNKDEKINEPFFFSTHPALARRVKNAKQFQKKHEEQSVVLVNEERFLEKTQNVRAHTIQTWLQNGMFVSANRYIQHYIQHFPEDAYGYYLKGEYYRKRQDISKAKKIVNQKKDKDYDTAVQAYTMALEKNAQMASAYRGRGLVYQKLQQDEKAKTDFQNYVRLDPYAKDHKFIEAMIQELSQ